MKKFLSMLLAVMLLLSVSSVAMAVDGEGGTVQPSGNQSTTPTASATQTFTFKKVYTTTAGKTPATIPSETLKFSVTAVNGNPDGTMITIADKTVSGNPQSIEVSVPSYTKVGKWNYTISEVAGNTQGVTYSDNSFGVQVLVEYDYTNNKLVASTTFTTVSGTDGEGKKIKSDSITNKYDLGSLTVTKNVEGNLASHSQKFDIDVTFTSTKPVLSAITGRETINADDWTESTENGKTTYSKTVTVSLAHNETATFNNIPAGVTYSVVEQAKHAVKDENGSNSSTGYTVTYTDGTGSIAADTTSAAVVKNNKGTTLDTGVSLDSLPYLLMLAVAGAGLVLMIARKRRVQD